MSAEKSLQTSNKQVFNLTTTQPRGEEEPSVKQTMHLYSACSRGVSAEA